jgi:tetratricopeptide (TPR) repeat protein
MYRALNLRLSSNKPQTLEKKSIFAASINKKMAETEEKTGIDVQETLGKAEQFVNTNRKSLSIIGGAVVLAVAGYLFYQYSYVAGKEKEAEGQMFRAEEYYRTDSVKQAINGDTQYPGFEDIISSYGVSPSANLAHFYLGTAYLKAKQYDKAIETLKAYDAKDEMTGSLALACIGDAYMEQKNMDEAVSYYEKAVKEKPNNFTTPIIMMKLGGAYEAQGKYKEAAELYTRLKKDYSTTQEAQNAEKYIARAEALAGTK